ncbi:MAG: hypothetical protein ACI9UR_000597 [Bacteroidia bacterium]|jgi:hypothetical protein
MMISRFVLPIFTCLLVFGAQAQDRLLLTNGKVKKLKGVVIYYDHDEILYQNKRQGKQMKKYVSRKNTNTTDDSKAGRRDNEEILAQRKTDRQAEYQLKAQRLRKDFEEEAVIKIDKLSTADFEKWKNKQLDKIKELESEKTVDDELDKQIINVRKNRKDARERAMFTRKVSRDIVFSILKADSTEIVVYNADTLGFFADGEVDIEYGVEQMRWFIKGQQAGRKHKVAFDVLLGVGVGAISAGAGAYWGPSIPAGTLIVTSIFHNKIKNKAGVEPGLFDNEAYRDGYERCAKRKKAWSFVKGSVAGLGFGILMWDGIVRGEGLPGPR